MSERESDIEFEFFEEPETGETTAEERQRRRGGRPPVRPPTGLTPLLRLVGLIGFAILVVLLLVFLFKGCGDNRKDAYRSYMGKVADLATASKGLGHNLNTLLTSRGKKQSDLVDELDGLANTQQQQAAQARKIDAPGPLREQHRHLLEALELRVSGLQGMAEAFKASKTADPGATLAGQMERLVASDVVWDDLFKDPAKQELNRRGIDGVVVPESRFVPNPDIATSRSMAAVWQRIHGASTGGVSCSPRGTGLVKVTAQPSRQELTKSLNTIESTKELAFAVTVANQGCAQETQIPVTLTIQKSPSPPIVKRLVIDLIDPGSEKTIVFRNVGTPNFAERTTITVEVAAVPKEGTTSNNKAEYPAIFSLG